MESSKLPYLPPSLRAICAKVLACIRNYDTYYPSRPQNSQTLGEKRGDFVGIVKMLEEVLGEYSSGRCVREWKFPSAIAYAIYAISRVAINVYPTGQSIPAAAQIDEQILRALIL